MSTTPPESLQVVTSRRAFCSQVCQVASVGALATFAQACGGSGGGSAPSNLAQLPTVNGTSGGATVSVQIDSASPLNPVGGAAVVRSSIGVFLVARTAADRFSAVNGTCTHEACAITGWDNTNFVCPCHGSRFSTAGQVLNGPARTSLRVFNTQFANNVLTISA
jgi:Rieske Fe-S protein